MSDLPSRLPTPLSERLASAASAIYNRQGREVDVAVAGIPFLLATYTDLPESIETVQVRKDQLDTEQDPGEQSLTGWWRRSQASWHEGAGLLYQEDATSNAPSNGFYDSSGVDVFTQGRITLQRRMDHLAGASLTHLRPTADGLFTGITGGNLVRVEGDGTLTTLYDDASAIQDGLLVGSRWYVVTADGNLKTGTTSSTDSTWPLGDTVANRLMWGKGRLWVVGGKKIWQPDVSAATGTTQSPIFTNPNPGWSYTCGAEGPGAMYFGGNDGVASSIQAIAFDSSGGIPTLSGATVTASMPDGELVQQLAILAGTYFGIGTNHGFRVGVIDVYTNAIQYGPILFVVPKLTADTGCTALICQNRFFLAAFATDDDTAQTWRIDTSTPLGDGVYPYAKDVAGPNGGDVSSGGLATSANGQRLILSTAGDLYLQSADHYVESGWIQSGRIRFRTTEPKAFKYINVGCEPLEGDISVDLIDEGGGTRAVGSVTKQGSVPSDDFAVQLAPCRYVSIRMTLAATGDATAAPVVNSYLLKALPAVKPQRLITLPLLCYDYEQAKSGQRYGGDGYAHDRLAALQSLEDYADSVTFQDFSEALGQGHQVVIDGIKFVQTAPSPPFKNQLGGAGGILQLQLRTID